jgi:hypothetical protein
MDLFQLWGIVSGTGITVFTAGKLFGGFMNKNKTVDNIVDNHDSKINELSVKVDKMAIQVNLIESESNSNKDSLHKMRNDMNSFMSSTNHRFEKSEKNQSIQLMLMSQLCEKQGIDTSMAEFLLKE